MSGSFVCCQFPTPASIADLTVEEFRDRIWTSMGRRVQKQVKIQEMHALAVRSTALPMATDSPAVTTFRLQLERYLQLCQARNALERQADSLLSARLDYQPERRSTGSAI